MWLQIWTIATILFCIISLSLSFFNLFVFAYFSISFDNFLLLIFKYVKIFFILVILPEIPPETCLFKTTSSKYLINTYLFLLKNTPAYLHLMCSIISCHFSDWQLPEWRIPLFHTSNWGGWHDFAFKTFKPSCQDIWKSTVPASHHIDTKTMKCIAQKSLTAHLLWTRP